MVMKHLFALEILLHAFVIPIYRHHAPSSAQVMTHNSTGTAEDALLSRTEVPENEMRNFD